MKGVGREGGVASDCVLAEFGSGFPGIGEAVELADEFGAIAVADEGHVGNLVLKFGAAEFDDLTVWDAFFEPGVDVFELALGEGEQAR